MKGGSTTAIQKVNEAYEKASENITLRAAIQLIPNIGGALDVLLFTHASKIKQQRTEEAINNLQANVK